MALVPATRVWVTGEIVTAAYMNDNLTAVLNFLLAPPLCQVRQSVVQPLANNTFTSLTFATEDVDSAGMHSTSSNTDRLTSVYAGWYRVGGKWSHAVNGTGNRGSRIVLNGTTAVAGSYLTHGSAAVAQTGGYPFVTMNIYLAVGAFITFQPIQISGGALDTAVAGSGSMEQPYAFAQFVSN